jgi:EAL domain-containing protein (putative c-di-GMP-specific phosphodiesterase class I)/GGDEF domain-containing protein
MRIDAWMRGSLRRKLTLIYSALFGGILLLVAGAVYSSIKFNAERSVERELLASVAAFERLWSMSAQHMAASADVLSADFGFREAVATEDIDTIASAAQNANARLDGMQVAVAFPDGRFVTAEGDAGELPETVYTALIETERPSGVISLNGLHYQAVAVPVRAPSLVGWAIFWTDLNADRMQTLEQMSAIPVTATIMPSADVPDTDGNTFKTQSALGASKVIASFGEAQPVSLVITYPLEAAMAPYRPMLVAILMFSLLGAALLIISGGYVARFLTRPIKALNESVQELAAGRRKPVDVLADDEFGGLARSFNIMLGDLEAREAAIVEMAREDSETLLANRRAMNDDLRLRIEAEGEKNLRVVVIRVMRFQHVRAAIGHAAAAAALKVLAARIGDFTEGARPYRISSTDLGLILPANTTISSKEALRRLVSACSQPATIGDASVDLLLCCGLAEPESAPDAPIGPIDQAVVAADFAEKRLEPVAAFNLKDYGNPAATLSLMSEMLKALTDGSLALHYQPKYCLADDDVCGFEALIRWHHPVRGQIFPDNFIPIAEETGHVRQLTEWVVSRAIEDQMRLARAGFDLPISVNISGRQLNDESFALWAIGKVKSSGAKLCFEITETAVINDPEKALRIINLFRNTGIGISIDDYGAGLSSLSYLKQIPANELKIDKSFILAMTEGRSDQLMIQSTIDLAHAMGMSVVAEGVETEQVMTLLKRMGADTAQGYFISRPQTLEATLDFLGTPRDMRRPA